jgi:hypothetical protein
MLLFFDESILLLEGSNVVAALSPTGTVVKLAQLRTFFDDFADGKLKGYLAK